MATFNQNADDIALREELTPPKFYTKKVARSTRINSRRVIVPGPWQEI
jgi:hypothetical protein